MSELFDMCNVNINRGTKRIDTILTQSKKTDRYIYMSEFFFRRRPQVASSNADVERKEKKIKLL